MDTMTNKIAQLDWPFVTSEMHEKGYVLVPGFLSDQQCEDVIDQYESPEGFRKTVIMERYRFGLGEYKYFAYPLPKMVQVLRKHLYSKLVPIANTWMQMLNLEKRFPYTLQELHAECHANQQMLPTPLILKYQKNGFNTLHQDLYGDVYFPLQAAFFLNEPAVDYTGGEFVLTQQIPSAQSKAIVLTLKKGDMLIFTTNFWPIKGTKGYYRANVRHGVSEVHRGTRHTMGIIFHDAVA